MSRMLIRLAIAILLIAGGVSELEGSLGNAAHSSRVQALVDYFVPIDVALWYRQKHQEDAALIGAPVTGNETRLARANPVTCIDRADPHSTWFPEPATAFLK